MILNPEVFIEIFEECIVKLSSIIRYEHARHPKPAHDVFPDEVLNILLCDFRQGFSFYPLGEVIDPYYQKLHLSGSCWKGTQNIQIGRAHV